MREPSMPEEQAQSPDSQPAQPDRRKPGRWRRVAKWCGIVVAALLLIGEVAVRVLGLDPPPVLTIEERDHYKDVSSHLRWQYEVETALDAAKAKLSQLRKSGADEKQTRQAQGELAKSEKELARCRANAPERKFRFRGYWAGVPVEFEQYIELNDLWLRDYVYKPEKPPNVRRVVILGDSYTTAWEVEFDEMYHKRLAHDLTELAGAGRKVEVPAFSVPAMGVKELKRWFLQRAMDLDPDVLALVIAGTLVSENYDPLKDQLEVKFGRLMKYFITNARDVEDQWLCVPFSALNRLVARLAAAFYIYHLDWFEDLSPHHPINPTVATYFEPTPPEWQKAWDNTAQVLADFREACRKKGVPLLVVLMPTEVAINDVFARPTKGHTIDWGKVDRKFAEMCKAIDADFLTLTPVFDAYRAEHGRDYQFTYDIHWNAKGHELAARAILNHLRQRYARQLGLAGPSSRPKG